MTKFIKTGHIVATESEDSDVFTFLELPLNDVDTSQRSSGSRSRSIDNSSGRGPQSILKSGSSYNSLSNLSQYAGQKVCAEEPDTESINLKRNSSVVSFQSVNVREYDRVLGDNPSCMSGPPISLDWSYSKSTAHSIDEYEGNRQPKSGLPHLNKFQREQILRSKLGYSDEEIEAAKKEKKMVQRRRSFTQLVSPFWRIEHACQSMKRNVFRRKKRNEKDALDYSLSQIDSSVKTTMTI